MATNCKHTLIKICDMCKSPAHTLRVSYLQLTCDWTFKMIAMACNSGFNMLNILLAILRLLSQSSSNFRMVFPIYLRMS